MNGTPTRLLPRLALVLALVLLLAACGSTQVGGGLTVTIAGGDREVPLDAGIQMMAVVTGGGTMSQAVSWTSSDTAVATVDAAGLVATSNTGATTITATSVADTTKSDSVLLTVTQDPARQRTFDATFVAFDPGEPPMLGVSFVFASPDALTTSAFTEVDPGLFVGPVSPISADGEVEIILPASSDVPSAGLVQADAFLDFMVDPGCELTASLPTAEVTLMSYREVMVPGVLLTFFTGFAYGILSDSDEDITSMTPIERSEVTEYSWVYADAATSLRASDCPSTGGGTPMISVDVDLTPGWNQVAWTFDYDATSASIVGLHLGDSNATDMFLVALSPTP